MRCHAVLELRVDESLQQLQQDCYRLENFVRKEDPQRRQEAKQYVGLGGMELGGVEWGCISLNFQALCLVRT